MTPASRWLGRPPGLLVSVRDADEAVAALRGATIVDVKEPSRGPLGRPDVLVVADVLRAVDGRAVVTLACGELAESPNAIMQYLNDVIARLPDGIAGPVAVKAGPSGLAPEAWRRCFQTLAVGLPHRVELVAVAYADSQTASCLSPDEVLDSAARCGARTLLVDTFDKAGPGLLEHVAATTIQRWVDHAHAQGLAIAIAGKLTQADMMVAIGLGADVVGVRSAACDGGRLGRVDPARVEALGRLVRGCPIPGTLPSSGALIA